MTTRRGANTAQEIAETHPTSVIVRLRDRAAEKTTQREVERAIEDDDDLYGNMPFTD
jgi:hypothetical protein